MSVDQIARWGFAALVVAAWNSSAFAAGEMPSRATLNEMGLGSMHIMTDAEGLSVRGQGAIAYGKSWAVVSLPGASAGSTNGYLSEGSHSAEGENLSFAHASVKSSGGHGSNGGGYGNDKGSKGGSKGGGSKPINISAGAISGGSSYGAK
jgi:hypothetical protein